MIIAAIQNNPVFGRIEKNLDSVCSIAADENFDLLALPELFATGYQFKSREEAREYADPAGEGKTFERLSDLAVEKQAVIVYGFPERRGEALFNSALAVAPDRSRLLYQKIHLFDTEKNIFDPGRTGFGLLEYNHIRIGLMICFDWRFPEAARKLALLGAQIICHPSNLVLPHCPDAMVTRALENNLFTVTADRVGTENRTGAPLEFIGRSRIVAPDGTILNELGKVETGFVAADINPELADRKQITPGNDIFADRRPEFY